MTLRKEKVSQIRALGGVIHCGSVMGHGNYITSVIVFKDGAPLQACLHPRDICACEYIHVYAIHVIQRAVDIMPVMYTQPGQHHRGLCLESSTLH